LDYFKNNGDGMYELNINGENRFFENNKNNRGNLAEFFAKFLYDEEISTFKATKMVNNIPVKVPQYFKEGETNCLFTPIIDFCNKFIDDPKNNKKTKENYITIRNKSKKYIEIYKDGVPDNQEVLNAICDNLKITIEIFSVKKLINEHEDAILKSYGKKSILNFKFYNTRENHVDLVGGLVEEVDKIETPSKDDFYIAKNYNGNITELITKNGIKRLMSNRYEVFEEFEILTGMKYFKINANRDRELSDFIFKGCHDSQTYDFKYIIRPEEDGINSGTDRSESIEGDDKAINSIDQVKSYINCRSCDYYEGYPAKITDFRKTDRIQEIGYYEVRNLKVSELYEKLGITDGVYPSPFLKFLKDRGATFEIFQGCWGTKFDLKYPEYMSQKAEGISYYSLHAGCSTIQNDKTVYTCCESMKNLVGESYTNGEKCVFTIKKGYNKNLAHVYGFTFSYVAIKSIMKIEEIIKQNGYNSLVRVCKDGVYYTGEKMKEDIYWTHKDEIKLKNYGCYYINSVPSEILALGEPREFYQHEGLLGAGGTGKTKTTAEDLGNIGMCYIVSSYKLLSRQLQTYKNLHGVVLAYIHENTKCEPTKRDVIKFSNVLLIDECSMITEDTKNSIINNFKYHKIIFIGDPECQLGPCGEKREGESIEECKARIQPMTSKGLKITEFTTYYRFDEKFAGMQENIRKIIKCKDDNRIDVNNMLKMFQKVSKEELLKVYRPKDIILCYRVAQGLDYNKMFDHYEKYYIEKGENIKYPRGCIYLEKPTQGTFIKRHGYTTHCVQGETFEDKIYIDIEDLKRCNLAEFKRLFYTAISRARKFENIYLIV
jgi:hypothetical protein